MSNHHDWTDHAASYVLGALDEDERRAFEAHLEGCARCREDVSQYADATQLIAQSVPVVAPPAALRERVLAEAGATRPIATARSRRPAFWRWSAAAGFVLAVGAGLLYLNERAARSDAEQRANAALARATSAESAAALAGTTLAERDSLLAALLAEDVRTTCLAAAGRPPAARVFWSRARGRVVIATFNLPPASAGRTYQLWGISDGQAISIGTFNTGADLRAAAAFVVPADARFQLAAVTEEPAGGSPQPTTTPFLVGTLPDSP